MKVILENDLGDDFSLPEMQTRKDHREVETVFAEPLWKFIDPPPNFRGVQDLGLRGKVPIYHTNPGPTWGLTAYILDLILQDVILPCQDANL